VSGDNQLMPEGANHRWRVRLRRTKGWRLPEGAVVVARPTRWGNPFRVVHAGRRVEVRRSTGTGHEEQLGSAESVADGRALAVALFEQALHAGELAYGVADVRRELAGRHLACWCPLEDAEGKRVPCHADVLLEVANFEVAP
jgi:hypothetical protein